MPFEKGNKYGELSKRSKDEFKKEIKEKLKENVFELIDSLDIEAYTEDQKLKYLSTVLPYIIPKQKNVSHDISEDVPLFVDEAPRTEILIFDNAEQKQVWDAASEEERKKLVKPYTFEDKVDSHFKEQDC